MEDVKQYFQEPSSEFTIYVVEQRFVVGQGKEYFKTYRGTNNFISTEDSIKKSINKILFWTQKHIPNITEIIKMCFFTSKKLSILDVITELSKLFTIQEHQAAGPEVIDPIIIQEGEISAKSLAQLISLHKSSILRPAIIILLKDNDFERAKQILSNCPHGINIKLIRNSGKSELYKVINRGANNIEDFIDAFSRQCFSTCSHTPRKLLLNKEWAENSFIKLYSPSILKIRTNLLFDEKDEVRDDINTLISAFEKEDKQNIKQVELMKSFECVLRLFRVYCNDFGGIDLLKSEEIAKNIDNELLLAHVYRYANLFSNRDTIKKKNQLQYAEEIFRKNSVEDHAIYCMNNRLVNTFYTDYVNTHDFDDMQKEALNNVPGLVGMSIIYNNLGVAYLYNGYASEALTFFQKGLDYSRDRVVQNWGLKSNILIAKAYLYEPVSETEIRILINGVFDVMGVNRLPFISANYIINAISIALRQHPGLTTNLMQSYPIRQLLQNAFEANMLGSGSLAHMIFKLQTEFSEFKVENLSFPSHLSSVSGIRANFLLNHGYHPIIFNAWL